MDYENMLLLPDEELYLIDELTKIDWLHKPMSSLLTFNMDIFVLRVYKNEDKYIAMLLNTAKDHTSPNQAVYNIYDNLDELVQELNIIHEAKPKVTFYKLQSSDYEAYHSRIFLQTDCMDELKTKYPNMEWMYDNLANDIQYLIHRETYHIDIFLANDSYYYVTLHEPIPDTIKDNMKFCCNGFENLCLVIDMILNNDPITNFVVQHQERLNMFNDLMDQYR